MNRFDLYKIMQEFKDKNKYLAVHSGENDKQLKTCNFTPKEIASLRVYEALYLICYEATCIRCKHWHTDVNKKRVCLCPSTQCAFSPMPVGTIQVHDCYNCAGYSEELGMCDVKIGLCKNHELWMPSKRYLERLADEEKKMAMPKMYKRADGKTQMLSSEMVERLAEIVCGDPEPHSDERAVQLFLDYILRLPEEFTLQDVKNALHKKLHELTLVETHTTPKPGDVVVELENSLSGRAYRVLIWAEGMTTRDPLGFTTYKVVMNYSDVMRLLNGTSKI